MDNEKMHTPLGNEITLLSENGIPVYFSPNPALHSFCLSLYVRGGSLFEAPAESGCRPPKVCTPVPPPTA